MEPLTPAVFHILLALADGEKHGYAIMRETDELSGGRVAMGPGTLYGTIKRMLAAGLIEEAGERDAPDDNERRRYYKITSSGHKAAVAEAGRLEALVMAARQAELLPARVKGASR